MEELLNNIWGKTLKSLEEHVAKASFETWLKRVRPAYLENSTLILEVPNKITKEWIQTRYVDVIKDIFSSSLGKEIFVDFIIKDTTEEEKIQKNYSHIMDDTVKKQTCYLNPRYTFENFVVGDSNKLSYAAATAVAGAPGRAYNPLLIYGGVGLGKTHLMQAIGHYIVANHKRLKVLYVTCELFGNELIAAISERKTEKFKQQYRTVDVLLMDDIQFIIGKPQTQEEFFHTFNTLFEANKQIVITSDRPPKEFAQFVEERLKSRIGWGLVVDIQPPDIETRIAILQRKCKDRGIPLPNNVLYSIAEHFSLNIRDMEGALNRVIAEVSIRKSGLSDEEVKNILKDIVSLPRHKLLTIDKIKEVVAKYFNVSISDITSQRRLKSITYPRQFAMFLCREFTNSTFFKIGEEFGNRDHTTVMHACDKIQKEIKENPEVEKMYQEICNIIKNI